MDPVVRALSDQLDELASMVGTIGEAEWRRPSACVGWSVADVVLHLAQTNEMATGSAHGRLLEAADGAAWAAAGDGVDEAADAGVAAQRGASGAEVYVRWQRSADEMVTALREADPEVRVQWVAGDMSPRTLATTRIAETWIHTGDVAIGLGVHWAPTDRLRHIAYLVHRTVPYAFARGGLAEPRPVAFVLVSPDGRDEWVFGDRDSAATVVQGPALDLCLVAGQRAEAADTALVATGPDADELLAVMRTFA